MSLEKTKKPSRVLSLLTRASSLVDTDPELAWALVIQARDAMPKGPALLPRAWLTLISGRLAWIRSQAAQIHLPTLEEAILGFRANDHFDEVVMGLALQAQVAFVRGDLEGAVRASIRGFREVRASPSRRLAAARAVMWALPAWDEPASLHLLNQIRQLAEAAPPGTGRSVARAYLAFRDFKAILYNAGIPTDTEPFPPPASLDTEAARDQAGRLAQRLEEEIPTLRACLPADPAPLLLVAAIHGFATGTASCIRLALEVKRACGELATPYIHSVIGVAHLRNHQPEAAIEHLERALDAYRSSGRRHEAAPWEFYLSLGRRALGQFHAALEAGDRFQALGQRDQHRLHALAMLVRVLQDEVEQGEAPAPVPVRMHASKPRYVTAALQWMKEHLDERVSVQQIVDACGVSRRSLEIAFRETRNRSLIEELRRMRMDRARDLLRTPNLTLAEIRTQVGYRSASAFSKDFRKVFGTAPSRLSQLDFGTIESHDEDSV